MTKTKATILFVDLLHLKNVCVSCSYLNCTFDLIALPDGTVAKTPKPGMEAAYRACKSLNPSCKYVAKLYIYACAIMFRAYEVRRRSRDSYIFFFSDEFVNILKLMIIFANIIFFQIKTCA